MYPLNVEQPYPRNQWWVGALGSEVTRTMIQRSILDEPVLFYRTQSGEPVAMYGLCPHRLFPLVKGRLVEDSVECGYHGFTFDCSGTCVKVPSEGTVPRNFRTRVYPTAEVGGFIWVWTGDPALADRSQIPDIPGVFKEGWETTLGSVSTYPARYQLLIDNLLDLTHLGFVHASIVGEVNVYVQTPIQIVEEAGLLTVIRETQNNTYGVFGDFMFGKDGSDFFDARDSTRYYGPCAVITGGPFSQRAEISPTGHARELGTMNFLHFPTPETPNSTHYFGGISRNYRIGDSAYSAAQIGNYEAVRAQDVVALSAIEPYVDRYASTRRELSAKQDAGAIRVRKRLAAQIKSESSVD